MPTLHKTGANFLNVEVDFVPTPALLQSGAGDYSRVVDQKLRIPTGIAY